MNRVNFFFCDDDDDDESVDSISSTVLSSRVLVDKEGTLSYREGKIEIWILSKYSLGVGRRRFLFT